MAAEPTVEQQLTEKNVGNNVIFKTSTTGKIDDLLNWNKTTGEISANTTKNPISPGTVYFTSDGHIIYDLANNTRLWMGKEAYSAIYAKDIDSLSDIADSYVKKSGDNMTGRLTLSKTPLNQLYIGSGTAASTSAGVYYPAKWTFNTDATAKDGDIITIKIPVTGSDYGTYLSVDNGSNYHPVVINGSTRLTSQYAANTFIQLIFEANHTVINVYPLEGGTSRVTTNSGVWRVLNYYDSNTIPSAYCTTAATNVAKYASCSGFYLTEKTKTYLHVLIQYTNTAQDSLTLNVNGSGAKQIYINGTISSSSNCDLPKGSYIAYYDGTNYHFRTDGLLPGLGTVGSASKLQNTTAIGGTSKPVYFTADGVPAAINYTIEKSVPSNALFTDTTYSAGAGLKLENRKFSIDGLDTSGGSTSRVLSQKGTWIYANNYSHPSFTAAAPAAIKVGRDTSGHVVLGNPLTKADIGLSNVEDVNTTNASNITSGTLNFDRLPEIYWANIKIAKNSSTTTSPTFSKVYIGSGKSYGNSGTPVYWNDGVPAAIDYTVLRSNLGLSSALRFVGKAKEDTYIYDGKDNSQYYKDGVAIEATTGDVVIDYYSNFEYVWLTDHWERLGGDSSYKIIQDPISKSSDTINKWISTINQDKNGNIDVGYSTLDTSGTWSGIATKAIQDENGNNIAETYLPLSGGVMTGNIRRYYDSASDEPMITALSNNQDILLFEVGHKSSTATTTTSSSHYKLKYTGTGLDSDNSNYLQLIAYKTSNITAVQIDEIGNVTLPQSLILSNGTVPQESVDRAVALKIGNLSARHLAIGPDTILAKETPTSTGRLYINQGSGEAGTGGAVYINGLRAARFTNAPYNGASTISNGKVLIADGTEGQITTSNYTINANVPSGAVFTDTKNTAGSTNITEKIFLIGATEQSTNSQTYSNSQVYVENGSLYLIRTQDLSGTADNKPALILGGTNTQPHLEFDTNEIQAKASGTTASALYINTDGGLVQIGAGGLSVSGIIKAKQDQYTDSLTGGALDMNNSNIYSVNSIYTKQVSNNAAQGIHFYRNSSHVDSLWINNGDILFTPNREIGISTNKNDSQKVARFISNPIRSRQLVVTNGITGGVETTQYLTTHPENSSAITIPFINNDLAFLKDRGGNYECYTVNTGADYTVSNLKNSNMQTDLNSSGDFLDNCFNGCGNYTTGVGTVNTDIVVIDIICPKAYLYTSSFYIDFGANMWGAKNISLYARNSKTDASTPFSLWDSIENNSLGSWQSQRRSYSSTGINEIRIVLTDWVSDNQHRIAAISITNYASLGVRETFMSRGIDDPIYRSITPNITNRYNLGSSSNQWKAIYGALKGNADTATKLQIARALQVKLDSTSAAIFDGSADQTAIPVSGILPVTHGGTNNSDFNNQSLIYYQGEQLTSDPYLSWDGETLTVGNKKAPTNFNSIEAYGDIGVSGDIYPFDNGQKLGDNDWEWDEVYSHTFIGNLTGNANTATAANITTPENSVAYYNDTKGTFAYKASTNGALYATAANGELQWGTLPIKQGGTGTTAFTANHLVYSTSIKLAQTNGIYTNGTKIAINRGAMTNSSDNFEVNGNSYFNGKIQINNDIYPSITGSYNLGDTDHKWDKIYVNELAPDHEYTKTLMVTDTTEWVDIGIEGADIDTGTNIIQIYSHNTSNQHWYTYWSGIFSWYNETRSGTSYNTNGGDMYTEIPLHAAGHALNSRELYLRVIMPPNGTMKLQMKSNKTTTSTGLSLVFKIKHII